MRRLLILLAFLSLAASAAAAPGAADSARNIRLTVVFDNESSDRRLGSSWGFACLIRGYGKTILFDTGANGDTLLDNLRILGLDPRAVQTVALSHEHGDHTNGLTAFLAANPEVEVFLPGAFPDGIKSVAAAADRVHQVNGPVEVCPGVSTTGELGEKIIEQALVLRTSRGIVVLTGCAHPGIERIAAAAKEQTGEQIYLVAGGFHLGGADAAEIGRVIGSLKALGVQRIAPTHCTGDRAVEAFRASWGEDCLEFHLGSTLSLE